MSVRSEAVGPATTGDGGRDGVLPPVGPEPGISHWHAAYVVRVCDDVLDPFAGENDPLGIHSHGDGLIHVHPFVEESGFENATLGLFADAMGFTLSDGALTLPGGGTWRDGDLCGGVPGRVFVDRWVGPDPDSPVTRVFEAPAELRFEADRELYQIAFAPADSPPVVPPAWERLDQVSAPVVDAESLVRLDPDADPGTIRIYPVGEVTAGPCSPDWVPESVLSGEPACFLPAEPVLARAQAIESARAVTFDRRPAVELVITPALRSLIVDRFRAGAAGGEAIEPGLAIAIEVGGHVVSAPPVALPPANATRLIVSGGLSVQSAQRLADLLDP